MDIAAASGHLDILIWLHHNRTEGFTKDAQYMATIMGHYEVLEWLFDHSTDHSLPKEIGLQLALTFREFNDRSQEKLNVWMNGIR